MKKGTVSVILLLGLVIGFSRAIPVSAQASLRGLTGGNRASDYQPPTDNPQSDVSSNLQTTGSNLQPAPGQRSLSQPGLSGLSDLRVVGTTGEPNPNTTSTEAPQEDKPLNILPHLVIGLMVLIAIIYIIKSSNDTAKKGQVSEVAATREIKPEPLPQIKKSKKSRGKKSTSKKRKNQK